MTSSLFMLWENEAILEESADDVIQRFVVPEGERMEFRKQNVAADRPSGLVRRCMVGYGQVHFEHLTRNSALDGWAEET